MSVCLNCLDSFVPGKSNRKGFCSLQCWRAYEHSTKSHNCMGVSRINSKGNWVAKNKDKVFERKYVKKENLFEGFDLKIDEALENNWLGVREKSLVKVTELSTRGRMILLKALEDHLKYLKAQNGLF